MPSTEGPKCNLVKIGQIVTEKKTIKDYVIFIHGYSLVTRADNLGGRNFDCT